MATKTIRTPQFTYVGEVNSSGQPHGRGKKTFASGYIHEGTFANGVLHGSGKIIYPSGFIVEGEFVDGYRTAITAQSEPVITPKSVVIDNITAPAKPKTDEYSGEKNDKGQPHGIGTMRYADGTSYEGRWKYGAWYKKGTFTDGERVYEGFWVGTKSSASVTLTENGIVRHGIMDEGEFIEIK